MNFCLKIYYTLFFVFPVFCFSQEQELYNSFLYEKEFSVDLRLHTNGYALAANFGKIKTHYKTRLLHFEITEIKHPKEYKQPREFVSLSPETPIPKPFIYGKQNNFYAIHAAYGYKRYFSEKAKKKGVAVGITYLFGPSLGILKPYYLTLIRSDADGFIYLTNQKYSNQIEAEFLNLDAIYGAAGFTKGWAELKPIPGVHAKAGVNFDWGANEAFVKSLEVGIMVDAYLTSVPIIIIPDNRPYFVNVYLSLQLGKRW